MKNALKKSSGKKVLYISCGNFNYRFNDGGTLSITSTLKKLKDIGYHVKIINFWSRKIDKQDLFEVLESQGFESVFCSDENSITFYRNQIEYEFIFTPIEIITLYTKKNAYQFRRLIHVIEKTLAIENPDIIFTSQYDIFSLTAADSPNVHNFVRSMEPIEFQFPYPYRDELKRRFKNIKISASSRFLQKELHNAYNVDSFVFYPVFDFSPRVDGGQKEYITLINFRTAKGAYLFFVLACRFVKSKFLAVSGNKDLFDRYHQSGRDNLSFIPLVKNIAEVMKMTKVLLVPSMIKDACPRVIFEGLYYGIPILANKIGGITEILNDDDFLIAIENRTGVEIFTDYAQKLNKLIQDNAYYDQQARKSQALWSRWDNTLGQNFRDFIQWLES